MLKTNSLKYNYLNGTTLSFPNVNCATGSHWLMIGASGSGKTTLLHLMAGLMRPSEGKIILEDTDISAMSEAKLDKFRGQNIGLILQQPHLIQSLTIGQNLKAAAYFAGNKIKHERIIKILDEINLEHKIDSFPGQLSQGERQRVGIARSIVNQPKFILADEPTSALDDKNTMKVMDLLKREAEEMKAILMIVTHDNRLKEYIDNQIELL